MRRKAAAAHATSIQTLREGHAEDLKLGYVLPVDETWFVGSGVYIPGVAATFNTSVRETLVQRVKAARDYAQEHGREAARTAFNDLSGDFATERVYILPIR